MGIQMTAVVPARNEEKNIVACVESLIKASRGYANIIFINDGSTDKTLHLLEGYKNDIKILTGECKGLSNAKNKGIQAVTTPFVVFLDADTIIDPDLFRFYAEDLEALDMKTASIGGSQAIHPEACTIEIFNGKILEALGFSSDYIHPQKQTLVEVRHNANCNAMYRVEALKDVGCFDETLLSGEDLDLDIRLIQKGYRILHDSRPLIFHRRPTTIRGFIRMFYRYGMAHGMLFKKYPFNRFLHFVPFFSIIVLLAIFFFPQFALIGALFLLLLLMIRSKMLLGGLLMFLYLFPLLFVWNIGFLKGLFKKMNLAERLR